MNSIQSRTDLALELQEDLQNMNNVDGLKVIKKADPNYGITETKIIVTSEGAAEQLGKPIGNYITLESKHFLEETESYYEEMSQALFNVLSDIIGDAKHLLVAGLGNMEVTPDALGPLVVENLFTTRHLIKKKLIGNAIEISAISPGVMAQTGMESSEILKGVIEQTKPDVLIVIDALAARNSGRLNKTIQISDTGIAPGSGVGNHRNAITEESMGVKVIAVGVPTVISVPTIVNDSMSVMLEMLDRNVAHETVKSFTEEERYQLAREILDPDLKDMFVTPKNIDEAVRRISFTISEALNHYNANMTFNHNHA